MTDQWSWREAVVSRREEGDDWNQPIDGEHASGLFTPEQTKCEMSPQVLMMMMVMS